MLTLLCRCHLVDEQSVAFAESRQCPAEAVFVDLSSAFLSIEIDWFVILTLGSSLPAGWEKRYDPGRQAYYYIDHNTKQTSWTAPTKSRKSRRAGNFNSAVFLSFPMF